LTQREFAVTATGSTTHQDFFQFIQRNDGAEVERLLAQDAALLEATGADGLGPIMVATYYGAQDVIDLLIARGGSVDVFAAAALGRTDRLHELLRGDASLVHRYSPDGWTALHLAGHFGQTESTALLLEGGADIGAVARNRERNPLHSALSGRRGETARLLVDRGADVNARDSQGWRPLHLAANNGDIDLVQVLLDRGAEPGATNTDGTSAIDLATKAGHTDILALLQECV
jgi:ankyrin repeat protein